MSCPNDHYSSSFFPPELDIKERLLFNPYSLLFTLFSILWTLYVCATIFFFFKKKHSLIISVRPAYVIFYSAIGQSLMMLLYSLKIIIGPEYFPNFFDVWILWFAMPLHFLPYPLRCFRYILLYQLAKSDQESKITTKVGQQPEAAPQTFWQKVLKFYKKHPQFKSDFCFSIVLWILVIIIAFGGVFRTLNPRFCNQPGYYGFGTTYVYYSCSLAMFAVASIVICFGIYFVKDINNEFRITNEFIWILIIWIVCIVPYSILGIVDCTKYSIPIAIIGIVECVASFLVSFGIPVQIAYLKNEDVLKNSQNIFRRMKDLFENEEASALVYDWCFKSYNSESFLFLWYVNQYRKLSNHSDLKVMHDLIASKFIGSETQFAINVSNRMVQTFFNNQSETGITTNLFDELYDEVEKTLRSNVINAKLISKEGKIYKRFLATHDSYNEILV